MGFGGGGLFGRGGYSGVGVIREWGLIRSFTVVQYFRMHLLFLQYFSLFLRVNGRRMFEEFTSFLLFIILQNQTILILIKNTKNYKQKNRLGHFCSFSINNRINFRHHCSFAINKESTSDTIVPKRKKFLRQFTFAEFNFADGKFG